MKDFALIFPYDKTNRYSYNVLLGALETHEIFNHTDIFLLRPNDPSFIETTKKISEVHKKTIIGVSFLSTQIEKIVKLTQKLTKLRKSKKTLLLAGGPHPSGSPHTTLNLGYDYVVIGEGEETFIRFVNAFFNNNEDILKIKGLMYWDENERKYKYTGRQQLVVLDNYPPFAVKSKHFNPIEITRGCPYRCGFCQTSFLFKPIVRHRSIEKIAFYVEYLKKLGLTDIRVISPNAFSYGSRDGKTVNVGKLEELLSRIREIIGSKGRLFFGTFPSEVRPEAISEETLQLLKKYTNNKSITVGIQSGSDRILKLANRGHSVEEAVEAIRLALSFGFRVDADFIFGFPWEEEQDINETIEVMKTLVNMGAVIHAHTFMPLPGTPLGNTTPKEIDRRLQREIGKLSSGRKLYGQWSIQRELGKKIIYYQKLLKEQFKPHAPVFP